MIKTLFFSFLCILYAIPSYAKVQMRWLSVASILIEDEKTKILLDPAFTRPGVMHWLNLSKFKSNEKLVKEVLKENQIDTIDAIFVTHSHFDHSVDAPIVAKQTQALFYVDKSTQRIASAYKDEKIKTYLFRNKEVLKIGDFKITPIKREHAKIMHLVSFLPGDVPENFDFDFYDYKVGENWIYVVEHPRGTLLIDQGAEPYLDEVKPFIKDAKVLIQGIANRENDEVILNGYLQHYGPKIFVPNHFDNFLLDFSSSDESLLPGINLVSLLKTIKEKFPKTNVIRPKYGESITLLE